MNETAQKERRLMHMFLSASRLHHALAESKISNLGLHRSQHHMLMCIKHSDSVCQKDLAQKLEISPAAVAVSLKKLEAAGFVERQASDDDNRINNIKLTKKGDELIEKTSEYFLYIDHVTFESFTEEEMELFEALLIKMKRSLKDALKDE